jgi:hypothetical protein
MNEINNSGYSVFYKGYTIKKAAAFWRIEGLAGYFTYLKDAEDYIDYLKSKSK